ncbi:hypothetical protein AWH56_018250 [Anaerobacillus isosaccharinicus]|uniref:Uncharacterized protein n=1 Tax=Anaerobacillus isosaccharinicus TaxID=1532552 RepID=A0A1S2LEK1_9BACI|nr:hypothetical protein [Anaerobacillus isosaccharinicus]MBA5587152.1 hypothetical protein [Anaerobacillus isosaccharinicus]QOY34651.1 hypothetical protein AWH56_018250 [Anaerobacillus isosaccharinicus]
MKRRLKKKFENRYNILKEAERQNHKRKGNRCIQYELLPIGEADKNAMLNDEITPDYPKATHWLLDVYYWKLNNIYQIRVFPCTKFGGSPTKSPVRMIFSSENMFEKVVEDMKKDKFWDADY